MYPEISKKVRRKIVNGGYRTVLFDLRLLKKNYCCQCEKKLIIKKTKYIMLRKVFSLFEAEHNTEYLYYCNDCNYYIEYKKQREIAKKKNNNSKKLSNSNELISNNKVNLSRIGELFVKDID